MNKKLHKIHSLILFCVIQNVNSDYFADPLMFDESGRRIVGGIAARKDEWKFIVNSYFLLC